MRTYKHTRDYKLSERLSWRLMADARDAFVGVRVRENPYPPGYVIQVGGPFVHVGVLFRIERWERRLPRRLRLIYHALRHHCKPDQDWSFAPSVQWHYTVKAILAILLGRERTVAWEDAVTVAIFDYTRSYTFDSGDSWTALVVPVDDRLIYDTRSDGT